VTEPPNAKQDRPLQILISAGEASGDLHAARLVSALRACTGAIFFGMGGANMREAGVEILVDSQEVAVLGLAETLTHIPAVLRVLRRLELEARLRKPDLAIVVDSWGVHIRLAQRLKKQGTRLVYFISPQVWAWRRGRVHLIRGIFEKVLVIFPFEQEFYRREGVAAEFVGNPLVGEVRATKSRHEFAEAHVLDASRPIITLLPGSRRSELRYHVPVLAAAVQALAADKRLQFVVAAAPGMPLGELESLRTAAEVVRVVESETYNALAAADCSVVASGTATVEAALLGAPCVVIYRLSWLTAAVARRLMKTPYIAMVNVIAGRQVAPELIQENLTVANVAAEVRKLLDDPTGRAKMIAGLGEVRSKLGPAGAIERAADAIAAMLPKNATARPC
jgi:lipid-A-disaccharide synthase